MSEREIRRQLKELADRGAMPPVSFQIELIGGTDHNPSFLCIARLPDGREARGTGRTKVEARSNAAAALHQQYNLPLK